MVGRWAGKTAGLMVETTAVSRVAQLAGYLADVLVGGKADLLGSLMAGAMAGNSVANSVERMVELKVVWKADPMADSMDEHLADR